jgi:type IV pilus assembly protein PilE
MIMNTKLKGFTLVEVMIVVAIIAILATIAYPSYVDHIARSNRTEGQRELLLLANKQEQFYSDNRTYTADMTELGMDADPYIVKINNTQTVYSIDGTIADGGSTFVLTATPLGNQATIDTDCTFLSVNEAGQKTASSADCWR